MIFSEGAYLTLKSFFH